MSYIITADIKGVKYYLRIIQRAFHGKIMSFSHVGLKNNATKYSTSAEAEKDMKEIQPQSDWKLSVEQA